uniref:natural killer cells antigen CD94-like n=1 Tax=Solea senegalensis TaxID=28829 RepID=UPI001CD88C41|nr:natural killer cells antigen CD94-like [Solea senegalensis]
MSIYEDPDATLANMRYIKGVGEDGGERVERIIDIYESVGDQDQAQKPRDTFRMDALIVGVLCVLLVVGIIIMSKLYVQLFQEKEKLGDSFSQLQAEHAALSRDYCHTAAGWRRFRCSCYYKSTEEKNWQQSRDDCVTRDAHLVMIDGREEQEFVSEMSKSAESWIGLQSEKKQDWEKTCVWMWTDKSVVEYQHWSVNTSSCCDAPQGSTAFINLQGKWSHTNNGTKHWICEKPIYDQSNAQTT